MAFRIQLPSESYSVEPGIAAALALEITNEGAAPIKVEAQVEGLDPEWVVAPEPVIHVPRGETITERIYLKPPREPESLSGNYPFVVRVKDDDGEERTVSSSLIVRPFHNVSIDVQPRRGLISPFARETSFHVTVMNLGNVEHTVRLFASDNDELFAFEFDQEQVTVAPGAQKSVVVTVTPIKKPLFANARLQQLTVSARSLDDKTIATATHAQIEQRAYISPGVMWLLAIGLFFLAAGIILIPRPPVIDTFTVSPERVWLGDSFTVEWSASHARSVDLNVDGRVYSDLRPTGSKTISTQGWEGIDLNGRQITVNIVASNGRKEGPSKNRLVMVRMKEPDPEPEILEFSITPTEIVVGEVYQVTYKLSDSVTEAILEPIGSVLDPEREGDQFTALVPGEFDYKLRARNAAGVEVEKVVKVRVVRGSRASIVVFRVDPPRVDPLDGRVTLTWHVENASRIELYENDKFIPPDIGVDRGEMDRIVTGDTRFTLIVYDSDGNDVKKEVTVRSYIPPSDDFP